MKCHLRASKQVVGQNIFSIFGRKTIDGLVSFSEELKVGFVCVGITSIGPRFCDHLQEVIYLRYLQTHHKNSRTEGWRYGTDCRESSDGCGSLLRLENEFQEGLLEVLQNVVKLRSKEERATGKKGRDAKWRRCSTQHASIYKNSSPSFISSWDQQRSHDIVVSFQAF